jgi:RNA polymerase sigma-70 factor (ECF subfamily)
LEKNYEILTEIDAVGSIPGRNYGIVNGEVGRIVNVQDQSTETDRLLERVQSGDRSALGALFAGHREYLRRLVDLRMDDPLRRRVDASDVIQETQLVATRRIGHYLSNPSVSFRLWLRQTAIDQLVNLRRHHVQAQKRSVMLEARLPDKSSILLVQSLFAGRPSRILHQRELFEQVQDAVQGMGESDREILLLRHFEELTNGEIGELLGIDTDAVSKRYGRAIRRLREKLKEAGLSEGS